MADPEQIVRRFEQDRAEQGRRPWRRAAEAACVYCTGALLIYGAARLGDPVFSAASIAGSTALHMLLRKVWRMEDRLDGR